MRVYVAGSAGTRRAAAGARAAALDFAGVGAARLANGGPACWAGDDEQTAWATYRHTTSEHGTTRGPSVVCTR
jgi:hypothetical protein